MKVNLLQSKSDLYINFENNKESDIIIVTGISGSGKSVLSTKMKDIYNYDLLSFDILFGYEESRKITLLEEQILNSFIKKYPQFKNKNLNIMNKKVCNCFYEFVQEYVEKNKLKIIFEGSYFMNRVDFNKFKFQRIILKRTSFLLCLIRRTKRNIRYILAHNNTLYMKIKEMFWLFRYNIKNLNKWYQDNLLFLKKIDECNDKIESKKIIETNKTESNYMDNNLIVSTKEQKNIQLEGLLYIKRICEENDIKYFLASGTLLGAIKYKGYIPWDDDIDIYLIRKDYLKLIELMEKDNNPNYEVLTIYNTKDYYYPYAKLVSKKTKLLDNAKEIKKMGVFIDIFPLDYFDDEVYDMHSKTRVIRNLVSRRMKIINNIEKSNLIKHSKKEVKYKTIKDIIYNIIDIISRPLGYNFWAKLLDKKMIKKDKGKYLAILYEDIPKIFESSLFEDESYYNFEGYKCTSIKNYDYYLKNLYGEYMKDLPKNKQITHHQLYVEWRKEIKLSLQEQKNIQLEGLLYIKRICEENDIKYFLIGGTLLGAIKYKGYIPWDDDIDICLIRKDYLKLIELIEKDNNPNYEVLTIYNTKDYYYPYAKLVSKKTKLLDNAKEIKKMGVFIDILPMDYFNDDIDIIFHKTRFIRNMCYKRMRIKNSNKSNVKVRFKFIKDIIYNIVDIFSLPLGYKYWALKLDNMLSKYNNGKYVDTLYLKKVLRFDKCLFEKQAEYEFEGYKFTSIENYDEYLKMVYGDYWLELPISKQHSPHQLDVQWRR